jgi:uncharacterized membrane protein
MAIQLTSNASFTRPLVRAITPADVKDALVRGLDDFWAMPTHVIFLSMIYPVLGLILARIALGYGLLPLLFPLTAGFALVGTFAALGLCELSRRREQNLDTQWWRAFQVTKSPAFCSVMVLAIVLTVIFLIWLEAAQGIYPAATWGAIIAAGLVAGSLPFFIGLAIVMPVLGHTSWHVYRRAVGH